ncbi:Plant UBX domain-containing protein 4 [Cymbomonas tetramitiformis]|uniref:Plant UBX domain-containing protein 4 n=1 Tax=Cymbomonas tetramitiformis TaxID=36881 RepID=A0AAE0GL00_9CHLO|nr:Plant UBX domain-containing protein 4 [Cymbomonas tetramitiformis]
MENDEATSSFISITGSTPEQARFFLESSAWDISRAIDSFYDTGGAMEEDTPVAQPAPQPVAPTPLAAAPSASAAVPARSAGSGQPARPPAGNIRGFSDFQDVEDSDDDGPNEYYTGGEKSGMMVQDPNKSNNDDPVEGLFEKARQHGATQGNPEDMRPAASGGGFQAFSGGGRSLTAETPAAAPGAAAGAGPADPSAQSQPQMHTVTFWNNGFTVDDGPLRSMEDPANRPFLESIEKGECPRELEPGKPTIPVHVNLVRKGEDWTAPPTPKYVAFSGSGRTLGSTSTATSSPVPAPAAAAAAGNQRALIIDDSQPVTSLQLRLHDGTRMVARFNHTHTVQDIRNFINSARPDIPAHYHLMTSFPPTPLQDLGATITDAQLVGAVVIQKL